MTDVAPGQPGKPSVSRTPFDVETPPALDVEWTPPGANGVTITAYKLQYRRSELFDTEWTEWTLYGSVSPTDTTGADPEVGDPDDNDNDRIPVDTTSVNLPGLEPGATYEFQVRVDSDEGFGPWSDTGSGIANNAPHPKRGYSLIRESPVGVTLNAAKLLGGMFIDPDRDTLAPWGESDSPETLRTQLDSDGTFQYRFLHPFGATMTYGVNDGYGGWVSEELDLVGVREEVRRIVENSPAGSAVGDPVTAVSPSDETLSYTLTGEAADSFVINAASGQISVKPGATLDYETKTSYTGQVGYIVNGENAVVGLTIEVTDVAPGPPGAPTAARTRFEVKMYPALDLAWTPPTGEGFIITGYQLQYREQGDAEWTPYEDSLAADVTGLNFPGLLYGAKYEFHARADSDEGLGPWSDTGSGTANRPPQPVGSTRSVRGYMDEEPQALAPTLSGLFTDYEDDSLTYEVVSDDPGAASVLVRNGVVNVTANRQGDTDIYVTANDGYGGVTRSIAWNVEVHISRIVLTPTPTPTPTATPGPTPGTNPDATPGLTSEEAPGGGGWLSVGATGTTTDEFNPFVSRSMADRIGIHAVYDSLAFTVGSDVKLGIAESITPNEDGSEWTIVLKEATFHDGSPVRPEDVVYSLRTLADPEQSPYWSRFFGAVDADDITIPPASPDDPDVLSTTTLVVALREPRGDFLDHTLAIISVVAPEDSIGGEEAIGSGPFRLVSYEPGEKVRLARNVDYWDDRLPLIGGFDVVVINDHDKRFAALKAGRVDFILGMTPADARAEADNEDILLQPDHDGKVSARSFVMNTALAPFDNPDVVRAFKLAIDRQELLDDALFGLGEIGNDLVGKDLPGYNDSLPQTERDIEEARRLFEDAGVAELTMRTYEVVPGTLAAAKLLATQLAEVGVTLTL